MKVIFFSECLLLALMIQVISLFPAQQELRSRPGILPVSYDPSDNQWAVLVRTNYLGSKWEDFSLSDAAISGFHSMIPGFESVWQYKERSFDFINGFLIPGLQEQMLNKYPAINQENVKLNKLLFSDVFYLHDNN
jgi:hypothetical protein